MKKLLISMIVIAALGFAPPSDDAKTIIYKTFTINKMAGSEAISQLTIKDDKGRERKRKTAIASKLYDEGMTEKKIIRFLEPADVKGTSMLTFDYREKDDDMWIYLPALRKTRRIVSSEKGKSFMGSEFSNADMVMPTIDDFTYEMLNESDMVGDVECWNIEMTSKDDDVADEYGYLSRKVWIGKKDYVIRKAKIYDIEGELLKEMTVKEVKMVDTENKKSVPTHMEVVNVQNGRSSIMKMDKIIFNPNVKDEYFTVSYLEK